jgi:hypothetical protein
MTNRKIMIIALSFFNLSDGLCGAIFTGPPSILPECLDNYILKPGEFRGPSARARECTRLICGTDGYLLKIKNYALAVSQSDDDDNRALICITRKEHDFTRQ